MDVFDEPYTVDTIDNFDCNGDRTPSRLSNKVWSDYENGDDLDTLQYSTRKTCSSDRTTVKSTEPSKHNQLCRTSSTRLDNERLRSEPKDMSKTSGMDCHIPRPNNDFPLDVLDMKKYALSIYINENPKAADLRWSLFCAACHSYRYDSVLRPFPNMFLDGDHKDIDKLRDVAESCPAINILYDQMQNRNSALVSKDLINLLYWVLIHVREPQLKYIPKEKHDKPISKIISMSTSAAPDYIFQVVHGKNSEQQKFTELSKNYKIIQGFHDSRLDNFYSILNYGLRVSYNKLSTFGSGIYLTREMSVSLPYSQTGYSWGGSFFGSHISVVAVCEIIDHPDVKHTDKPENGGKIEFMTETKPLTEKYFIVQNSDLTRVKYLLIYCNNVPEYNPYQPSAIIDWLWKNKVLAVVAAYVFLLLALATSNSSVLYKIYKRMTRKMTVTVLESS